jgi:hypothetical protein
MMQPVRPRISCALARLALALLILLTALAAAHAVPATAQVVADPDYWKQTGERRDTVYRFVYGQSPQSIPSSYDPVADAEQILRQRQAALPASNLQAPKLWQEIRTTTVKPGLAPPLRLLGTVALAVETFRVGWKIGSGANAKYFGIGVPDTSHAGPENYKWDKIVWTPANTRSWAGAQWPAQDGWVIWNRQTCCNYYPGDWWFGDDCVSAPHDFTPPEPFTTQGPVWSGSFCYNPAPPGYTDALVYYGWAPENALKAPGPIEPYTNQPYSYSRSAPTPPPQTTVEQSIEDELAKPENNLLRQWLNYELGSPSETDPLGIGQPNADIEFIELDRHFQDHGDDFIIPYTDKRTYWRDAADIVERGQDGPNRDPAILRCRRLGDDPAEIYWDTNRSAWVIVKHGTIVTYYPPERGFDAFVDECDEYF